MVNKIFKYFFLLCDILLLVYLVIYTIRDEVLEMFKFKMTKFTLIASDIISLTVSGAILFFFIFIFEFINNNFYIDI